MSDKYLCNNCNQPWHGQTRCEDAASPRIKALLAQAETLRIQLGAVEDKLRDARWPLPQDSRGHQFARELIALRKGREREPTEG